MKSISAWGKTLVEQYPEPSLWPPYNPVMKEDVYRFANLWLTEGIPFAFQDMPMIFEACRQRMASDLGESPKAINLVGSARLGASLSPHKFGRRYDHAESDLDLFMVSSDWFNRLKTDAEVWLSRYRSELALPRNKAEEKYWPNNAEELPKKVQRGLIDLWLIPVADRYENARRIRLSLNTFFSNLNDALPIERRIKRSVGLRVYRDWPTAVNQIGYSLTQAWRLHSESARDE